MSSDRQLSAEPSKKLDSIDYKYTLSAEALRKSKNPIIQEIVRDDFFLLPPSRLTTSLARDMFRHDSINSSIAINVNGAVLDKSIFKDEDQTDEAQYKRLHDCFVALHPADSTAAEKLNDLNNAYFQKDISLFNCALLSAISGSHPDYSPMTDEGKHYATFKLPDNTLKATESNTSFNVAEHSKTTPWTTINAHVEVTFELAPVDPDQYYQIIRRKIEAQIEQSEAKAKSAQSERMRRIHTGRSNTQRDILREIDRANFPKFLFKVVEIKTDKQSAEFILMNRQLPDFTISPYKDEVSIKKSEEPAPTGDMKSTHTSTKAASAEHKSSLAIAEAKKSDTTSALSPISQRQQAAQSVRLSNKLSWGMLIGGCLAVIAGACLMGLYGVGTPLFFLGVAILCGGAVSAPTGGALMYINNKRSQTIQPVIAAVSSAPSTSPHTSTHSATVTASADAPKIVDPRRVPGSKDPRTFTAPAPQQNSASNAGTVPPSNEANPRTPR